MSDKFTCADKVQLLLLYDEELNDLYAIVGHLKRPRANVFPDLYKVFNKIKNTIL